MNILGHSRKHPYHPHRGNKKLTPLPPSDVPIHLLLSETIFSPLPLRTAEISSVGGVWICSGTTHLLKLYVSLCFFPVFLSLCICVDVIASLTLITQLHKCNTFHMQHWNFNEFNFTFVKTLVKMLFRLRPFSRAWAQFASSGPRSQ